ncbi:hypothetical protein MMOR_08390 [Mycolicibacterium moriokaense]|uniref:Uncharacterized protein n=1 Tax=Mycolicibacterium moriokaense TaxID=39691 RepID=A0AAD1H9R0_9MYCO|nr:hypothetical protein MMOR_08390 [Mycolicibacterium moriokaense]
MASTEYTGEVAGVDTAAVYGAGALLAGGEDAVAVPRLDPCGMEQKGSRDNVFAALQQSAYVVERRGAGRVDDAVGVKVQDLADVGGRGDADRLTVDERADVDAVLGLGVHECADELEIVVVVENGGDDLAADRAGTPLNHPMRHDRTEHRAGRRPRDGGGSRW